jgi:predicted HicB family RNase H-like nuclease
MSEMQFHYKGYVATVEQLPESGHWSGEISSAHHMIGFGGYTREEAYANFVDLIDDYPSACADDGIEPEILPTEAIASSY